MKYQLTAPPQLTGIINLPASKSISNRALILNALANNETTTINNLSDCDDTRVMIEALNSNGNSFDVGAAGTSMRFLTAFLSKIVGEWTITGSDRMKQRPIKLLVDALNSLGANISYIEKEGFPPLKILGSALKGGEIELNGGISSQYISALLMIAPTMLEGLKIKLDGEVISKPYIHMTLQMMEEFGVKAYWKNDTITIPPQSYKPVSYTVESDWSAASYWYEMLAIKGDGNIFLQGLRKNSFQGDAKIAELFDKLGVSTSFKKEGVELSCKKTSLKKFTYNFVEQPDMAQTFVVTCCMLGIEFYFTGLQSLKIKETDRIAALITEMRKVGFVLVEPTEGALAWSGERCTPNTNIAIDTYDDHRMAMAFAPISILQEITINNPEVVTKSYPNFWEDLEKVGFGK